MKTYVVAATEWLVHEWDGVEVMASSVAEAANKYVAIGHDVWETAEGSSVWVLDEDANEVEQVEVEAKIDKVADGEEGA